MPRLPSAKRRRRHSSGSGDSPESWAIVGVLAACLLAGAWLAEDLIEEESREVALAEPVTEEAIERFMRAHSLLEYTVGDEKEETLHSVAEKLRRLSKIDAIREFNPTLAEVAENEPLEPGTVLRIPYNGFTPEDLLGSNEPPLDGSVTAATQGAPEEPGDG